MGVKLSNIPAAPVRLEDLAGRCVAVDVPNLMYAFYTVAFQQSGNLDAARRVGQRGVVQRVLDLAEMRARCVLIFDGQPHPLKREVLLAREASRKEGSAPRLAADDYAQVRRAAQVLGVPMVDARHDAEAQACVMARRRLVDLVATTDWDALAMGAPLLLRRLSGKSPLNGGTWDLVRGADALRALAVPSSETLALACVLMGCDFFDGLAGVGEKKALQIARDHASPEALAHFLASRGVPPEERARAREALHLLVEPPSNNINALAWNAPGPSAAAQLEELVSLPEGPNLRAALARLSLLHETPEQQREREAERAGAAAARENETRLAQEHLRKTNPAQRHLGAFL